MNKYQEHIDDLLGRYDITALYKPHASPRAYRLFRSVTLQPVKGITTYYDALHELGHCLGPNPSRRLEQEAAAWRWAIAHASFPPSPAVWRHIARCLDSYVSRARRWGNMKTPEPDHDFWALLRTAQSHE